MPQRSQLNRPGLATLLLATTSVLVSAQASPKVSVATRAAGGNHFSTPGDVVYPPHRESEDRRLDMFFGDWRESTPRFLYGSLVVRDILTRGDNLSPPVKAAVLQSANFLAYGRLPSFASTATSTLAKNQEVLFFMAGSGRIEAGNKKIELKRNTAILIPQGLPFTLYNTGPEDLTMYILDEPVPEGFKPNRQLLSVEERSVPVRKPAAESPYTFAGTSGHWAHIVRDLFNRKDGLATVGDIITVEISPLMLGEPHPHLPGKEEAWLAIDGTSLAFVGPQLRIQPPGMAFLLRPDGLTQHANLNDTNEPVRFLWFNTNTGLSAQPISH